MPKIIGITGTIGSGKSAVGSILESLGVPVIDTDKIVHELLTGVNPVSEAVIARFGAGIVKAGSVDRQKLGKIVFNDQEAKHNLEAIVHPSVLIECDKRIKEHAEKSIIAVLVPLLFEAGLQSKFDQVWAVVADEKIIRQRLQQRDQFSDIEIDKRLAAQLSQKEKSARAHKTINNSGLLEETAVQVKDLLKELI